MIFLIDFLKSVKHFEEQIFTTRILFSNESCETVYSLHLPSAVAIRRIEKNVKMCKKTEKLVHKTSTQCDAWFILLNKANIYCKKKKNTHFKLKTLNLFSLDNNSWTVRNSSIIFLKQINWKSSCYLPLLFCTIHSIVEEKRNLITHKI